MEITTKSFAFIVIDTDMDFLVIKNPYCENCFRNKMFTTILSKYLISHQDASEFKKLDIRCIRIICECKNKNSKN